eukprot:scaffold168586_cov42-Prasinocladus_malaysianus.AAC.1
MAFLGLRPDLAVITNVELDHVDCFADEADARAAFTRFALQIRPGGTIISCGDDPGARAVVGGIDHYLEEADIRRVTYGLTKGDWVTQARERGQGYGVLVDGIEIAQLATKLPGDHNVLNSVAALAAACILAEDSGDFQDLPSLTSLAAAEVSAFQGVKRRFEDIGTWQRSDGLSIQFIDDYAHHPTEVLATLAAAREVWPDSTLIVMFQPHTASRLSHFMDEFAGALSRADVVFVLDTFAARAEQAVLGNSRQGPSDLVEMIKRTGPHLFCEHCCGSLEEVSQLVSNFMLQMDKENRTPSQYVIMTLGAGDVTHLGPMVLRRLDINALV